MTTRLPTRAAGTEDLGSGDGPRDLAPVLVEAIDGPGAGVRTFLAAGTVAVGTDALCELRLEDSAVSRRHATLELLPGAVMVRDLGSRNGTFYLEAKLSQGRVPVGGTLRVGRTTLRLSPVETPRPLSEKEVLHGLLGRSTKMRELFATLEKLGPTDTTALLQGETGTGKEAVARTIHALSPRAAAPFVVFDCAAANAETLETTLFGHARGAFTGAVEARDGLLASVKGGTLFLDEVGELGAALQPKLLRLLESRTYQRVGEGTPRKFEGRVLASSHASLDAAVRDGTFRSDLLFRLAVATVQLPPLRERIEDIPLLAAHFARALTGVDVTLSPSTLAAFQCDRWPGNVRELRNAVERAVALGEGPRAAELPASATAGAFEAARERLLGAFEKDYLVALIARHSTMAAAIEESKLSRTQFYRLLRRHQLSSRGKD
ncbi:MAG: sigma 54-interacting transcriptional regulator [Myxococcaceae bacterium]|nr:sigma 54-interacting transcriptional regulator [Myxococcaceae bacterium]